MDFNELILNLPEIKSFHYITENFSVDQTKIEAEYIDGLLKINIAKKEEAKL